MTSTSLFTVHFVARRFQKFPDHAMIYVRVDVKSEAIEFSVKKKVPLQYWDVKYGCVKDNPELEEAINPYLNDLRHQFTECVRQLLFEKRKLTPIAIKKMFLGEEESDMSLMGLVKYHNENMKTILTHGTLKNYYTTEKYLKLFLVHNLKRKDILLSDLKYQFITEFEFFLRSTKPITAYNPLTNNGVMKHMERLRKMTTLAHKMEWISKDPFSRYSLRFKKVDKAFLTPIELKLVEETVLPFKRLHLARDMFVFSCYTGLAYGDLMNLKPSHICIGMDGGYWIKTSRSKTDTSVNVPLFPCAEVIMDKYKNDPRTSITNRIFPALSNQKVNMYLKEIGALCGIIKPFSFHTARHTFATTITLSNGVPLETVSKMLGHTKLSTTQVYARVLEKKVSEDMIELRNRLNKQGG